MSGRPRSNLLSLSPSQSRSRSRAGPLACHVKGFADRLAAAAFARSTSERKLATVRDLGGWLESEGLTAEALDEQHVEAFLLTREPSRRRCGEAVTCRLLLEHLRESGRIPAAAVDPGRDSPIDRTVRTYAHCLINERGPSRATTSCHLPIVRAFLADRFGTNPVKFEHLSARDANQFVLRQAQRVGPGRCRTVATVLRGFLRHLQQRGELPSDLAGVVLPVRLWRLSGLPKALAPEQVEALLDSCDRGTSVGRRDRAVLLLPARPGLRSGEVVALTLDDFDWRAGVVTVSSKGRRRDPLPLPREVGGALAEYLQADRPRCATRQLFLRMRAPFQGLRSSASVYGIVRRAVDRAGLDLPCKGPHRFRHALASDMLRNRASLEDSGQILRHCRPETTQIYAQVDLEALRSLAPVWPGGAP